MHRLLAFILLPLLALASALAQETATGTSTITLDVGGGWTGDSPPGSSGVHHTLVTANQYGYTSSPTLIGPGANLINSNFSTMVARGGARHTTVPFGFRRTLPVKRGKVDLFLGGDGAYTWNANQNYKAWDVPGRLGARFALAKQRHVCLGTTGEYSQQFGWIRSTGRPGPLTSAIASGSN